MVDGVKLARSISRHSAFARQAAFELSPGPQVRDDEALAKAISGSIASYGHPTATAPLGGPDDPHAVVDGRGRVRGITGLRVVDASIIPQAPSAATNLTVIMLAEHICHLDYRH
jgi:choline dehydrogenase